MRRRTWAARGEGKGTLSAVLAVLSPKQAFGHPLELNQLSCCCWLGGSICCVGGWQGTAVQLLHISKSKARYPQQPLLALLLQLPEQAECSPCTLPARGSSQSKLPAMPPSVTDALWGHRVQGYQGDMATAGTTLALGGKAPENPDKASTTLSFRHRKSCSDPAAARAGSGTTRVSQSHNPSLLQNSTGWPCRY